MKIPGKQPQYQNLFLALLTGAGAGIVVGLLLAPKAGEKLRSDIGGAVDGYLGSAKETAVGLRRSANRFAHRGLQEVSKAGDAMAEAANAGADRANAAIDQSMAAVEQGARQAHGAIDKAAEKIQTGTNS